MNRALFHCLVASVAAAVSSWAGSAPQHFRPVDSENAPDLFVWTDTCNVYVLRNGDSAVLIDLGDGSVLDHLSEINVKRVEWVVFTHHHREQCQGAGRLRGTKVKLAAPAAERELFETPASFRKMDVRLEDRFTVYGASYVRPPIEPVLIDRALGTNDTFTWTNVTSDAAPPFSLSLKCVSTPGNSPGALSYMMKLNGRAFAFSGDVIHAGAKMDTWFDTEWDYGFAAGVKALRQSVSRLAQAAPDVLLPSHGPLVKDPRQELRDYADRLERLERLYIRGYDPEHGSVAYQDKVSKPTVVSNVWQVSPHLFKFKRMNFWPNFSLIVADNGRALLSDCGLLDEGFLDTALEGMRRHFGLQAIEAIIISHMHGDHFQEAQHMREKWGAEIWALDNMVDKMEHPDWFDYSAPIQAYGKKKSDGSLLKGVRVDRIFRSGDTFEWEGSKFTVDWMPGQTEFALCLHGSIDGRKVAFTGDNIFGDPDNPLQTGHEAMVAHNSAILEEGYIFGSEYLSRLKPDLLMGGHSFVMDRPSAFIERYRKWSYDMRDAFRSLSREADYRYWFDPYWVRAEPYRASLKRGAAAEIWLHVRNFKDSAQQHSIAIHTPSGIESDTSRVEGSLGAGSRAAFAVRFRAGNDAVPGPRIIAFDVTLDGKRFGERFDCILNVEP